MNLISFKDIFTNTPETPGVILVEGMAGTLKSALCLSLMLDTLKNPEYSGLYLTFEQNWKSHLVNMESLGLAPTENLLTLDYNIMRKELGPEEFDLRIFDAILQIIESLQEEKKDAFRIFTLDSLNAIYAIMDPENVKSQVPLFFKKLREFNIISLLIFEKTKFPDKESCFRERFLADGIISMGIQQSRGDVSRYLQPIKINAAQQNLKRRHMVASKDGISLLGAVYI